MHSKPKCVYIIPNEGNFKLQGGSRGGSATHIHIGIEELSKVYTVVPYIINRSSKNLQKPAEERNADVTAKPVDTRRWVGVLRDLKALITNNVGIFKLLFFLRKEKPVIVYERSEYLHVSGVVASRLLGVPHYFEANWIHYLGIQQFYLSWINRLARQIEEWMYNRSRLVFFVGNQHKLLKLSANNFRVIQNGVQERLISSNLLHVNAPTDEIQVCVLASLMKHHQLDILIESLQYLPDRNKIRLHFIGMNYGSFLDTIPEGVKFVSYGPLPSHKVHEVLSRMNIAVISGGPFYSSFMKLYEYAAFKLAVVCPDLENLTANFTANEICFFNQGDAKRLSEKLSLLIEYPVEIPRYGENLYNKVASCFTWEHIFNGVIGEIHASLGIVNTKRPIVESCVSN